MGLKAVLESLDGLDDGLKGHYKEDGDKFVLDIDGIDTHPKVRGVITANNENKRKRDEWKAKVDELEARIADLPEDFDPAEYEALKASAGGSDEEVQRQIEAVKTAAQTKIDNLTRKHAKDLEALNGQLSERDGYIDRTVKDTALKEALLDVGVDPRFLTATHALHSSAAKVVREDNGDRKAVFETDLGPLSVSEYIKEWAQGDAGKPFIKPATGPNTPGGKGSGANSKQVTRSQFDAMNPGEQRQAMADGVKVVDDAA